MKFVRIAIIVIFVSLMLIHPCIALSDTFENYYDTTGNGFGDAADISVNWYPEYVHIYHSGGGTFNYDVGIDNKGATYSNTLYSYAYVKEVSSWYEAASVAVKTNISIISDYWAFTLRDKAVSSWCQHSGGCSNTHSNKIYFYDETGNLIQSYDVTSFFFPPGVLTSHTQRRQDPPGARSL